MRRLNHDTLLYLYGLVPSASSLTGTADINQGSEIFLVRHEEIACAVSRVPAQEYRGTDTRSASQHLEWVMPRAWRHHEVLSYLHTVGTVVPLKFGTLCATVEDVRDMLVEMHKPILDLLARFGGKDEWTLTVSVDRDALSTAVKNDDPDLLALSRQADLLPSGRAYLARKKIEQATNSAAVARIAEVEDALFMRLVSTGLVSASVQPSPRRPGSGTMLVVNAALLMERHRFADLETSLAHFESEHSAVGLKAHLTGPWPPYSFATTFGPLTGARVN